MRERDRYGFPETRWHCRKSLPENRLRPRQVDVLTVNEDSETVSYVLNLGEGRFAEPHSILLEIRPEKITGADLNSDGDVDLAVSHLAFDRYTIIENRCDRQTGQTTLTDFSIVTGTLLGGGLPDLIASDDSYVHTRSGFGRTFTDLHNMEMVVDAVTNLSNPQSLDLTFESRIDEPAGIAQVRLFNYNTQQFEQVGSHGLGNTDAVNTIEDIDAADYVDPNTGGIELSIKHIVFVPFFAFTFESFVDHVEIAVK